MKPLYKKYETDKAEALLKFNLVALLAETVAELAASELDRLCIRLVRPQISGALLLSEKNFAGNYVATEGDEVGVHLLMPSGKNRLTIEAEFGTNTRTLAIVDIFTSADASGIFQPEAITTPVVKQLAVAPEDFQSLTERVGEVEETANQAKEVADAAQTAATGAQGAAEAAQQSAEAAQQTAESVNEALQEVISTGDIPAATVAKVAEHTTQIAALDENKANKEGRYPLLTAGNADNLVGRQKAEDTFVTQTTGGGVDFGNGLAELVTVEGNGLAWNQILPISAKDEHISTNGFFGNYAAKSIAGHKYFISFRGVVDFELQQDIRYRFFYESSTYIDITAEQTDKYYKYIYTAAVSGNLMEAHITNRTTGAKMYDLQLTDLSLIYGLGNEPTSVEQVEADLAKLTAPKPYYQPNAGELFGANRLHLVSYGQNLLNPSNGNARLAPYSYGDVVNAYGITTKNGATISAVTFTPDATGEAVTVTPNADGQFAITGAGTLNVTLSAGNLSDVYVWAVWDGKKDGIENFVPYSADALEIDVTKIYGKLNGADEMVQIFPNGMRATGILPTSVRDLVDVAGKTAKVNVGSVDLGTKDFNSSSTNEQGKMRWTSSISDIKPEASIDVNHNILCGKYATVSAVDTYLNKNGVSGAEGNAIYIYDPNYTAPEQKSDLISALNGVLLWYELATPAQYTDLQISDDGETFSELPHAIAVDNWGVWEQYPNSDSVPAGKDFDGIAAKVTAVMPIDAVEAILTTIETGITTTEMRAQLVNLLGALQAQNIIGGYEVDETPTDKVFGVTVTPYEPEPEPESEPEPEPEPEPEG